MDPIFLKYTKDQLMEHINFKNKRIDALQAEINELGKDIFANAPQIEKCQREIYIHKLEKDNLEDKVVINDLNTMYCEEINRAVNELKDMQEESDQYHKDRKEIVSVMEKVNLIVSTIFAGLSLVGAVSIISMFI